MSGGGFPDHSDLVALALGQLDPERERAVRATAAADPAVAREIQAIEHHLELHDAIPEIDPAPGVWLAVASGIAGPTTPAPRSLLYRFRYAAAAAAILAAAFLWPHPGAGMPPAERLFGSPVRTADGGYTCASIARLRLGDGVTVTMDSGARVGLPGKDRIQLHAGRVFFEVEKRRRGLVVEAGELRIVTLGTSFLVQRDGPGLAAVAVERGRIRYERNGSGGEVGPGESYPAGAVGQADLRGWFTRPTLEANLTDPTTLRVVLRNEMPDTIELAPPTGGEPLFYAGFAGHDFGLSPHSSPLLTESVALAPGGELGMELHLPRPVPSGEPLLLSYPVLGLRVEVRR